MSTRHSNKVGLIGYLSDLPKMTYKGLYVSPHSSKIIGYLIDLPKVTFRGFM
jgi:hypothetical protein